MKIAAVICEFNPFHNGHKHLLDEIRKQNYDSIICVMSGSFTQRGEAAITDKFSRTRVALKNGADLVIELPTPYAAASAERFAKGGVDVIKATGVVDKVFFGSEVGDIALIEEAVKATEDARVQELLKSRMNKGEYYPLALQKAVEEIFGSETAEIISEPNNTLGVEYVKELLKCGIKAGTIKRKAVAHDSNKAKDGFASASLIREMIFKGENVYPLAPYCDFSNPAKLSLGERAILYKLKAMSLEEIANLPDVTEGLHNRIFSAARSAGTLEELLFEIKTKRYTMARLRRIITSAVLGITKDLQSSPVPYLRILGMTEKGKAALSLISNKASLPIITSVAPALKTIDDKAKEMLLCDINATDIRTVFESKISESGKDFTEALIKE